MFNKHHLSKTIQLKDKVKPIIINKNPYTRYDYLSVCNNCYQVYTILKDKTNKKLIDQLLTDNFFR